MFVNPTFCSLDDIENHDATDASYFIVSKSRISEGACDEAVQSRRSKHSRGGTRTLEEEICVLDPGPSSRRERSSEGEVERVGGGEGPGRLGQSEDVGLNGLETSIFIDTSGMSVEEMHWKDHSYSFPYYERQCGWTAEPLGYEEVDNDSPTTYITNERCVESKT